MAVEIIGEEQYIAAGKMMPQSKTNITALVFPDFESVGVDTVRKQATESANPPATDTYAFHLDPTRETLVK